MKPANSIQMKYVALTFLLFPVILSGQYYFDFENDSSGGCGLSARAQQVPAGRWECAAVGAISGNFSLHHSYDNPLPGCDYFIISHDPFQDSDSLSVIFKVKHSYPPSTSNNWQVAMLAAFSDGGELPGKITGGLILGVNFNGSDDYVKLWSCMNGECEQILTTSINYQELIGTGAAPRFRLVWYQGGRLDLYCSPDPMKDLPELVGYCQLDTLPEGRLLVVRYEYSASQDRKLWLDEIQLEGNFVPDTIAPVLMGTEVMDETHLYLRFSEKVPSPACSSFLLSGAFGTGSLPAAGEMLPDAISTLDSGLELRYPGSIPNRVELRLWVKDVCDEDGNCLSDTLVRLMRNEAVWGDVVFTEVMSDPEPVVRLAEAEYLEILNRSAYELDLEGWKLRINDRSYPVSGLSKINGLSMDPGQYCLMVDVTLPNDGASLALYNREGTLIHAARYGVPWDGPAWKKEGGWSLESTDPDLVCGTSRLWEFSTDRTGGTPGRTNSNDADLEDHAPPVFMYGGFGEPGVVLIYFSERVRILPGDANLVSLMPGAVHPDSVVPGSPLGDLIFLYFSEHLPDQQGFDLQLPAVADCAGNTSRELLLRMGEGCVPRFGSLLINEIMYDPEDGAPEYIELYNPGKLFIDLQDLSVDVAEDGAPLTGLAALSEHSRILSPGEYVVITRDVPHLMDAYNLELSGRWLGLRTLPGLQNSGGTIYLANRAGDILDMANFGNHLHMDMLDDTKGISLERISANRPGTDPGNWHSAASIEGYATPGRKNSQSMNDPEAVKRLRVDPVVFSPDNDGYQDLLSISISSDVQGCVLRIWITDLAGNRVRSLANNHIGGPSASYVWDGERDDGTMASGGIYVIHVWGYHPASGNRWSRKVATGIIYR